MRITRNRHNKIRHHRIRSRRQRRLQAEQLETRIMLDGGGMAGEICYRVNVGGPEIVATTAWTADTSSSPSPYVNSVGGNSFTSSTSQTIDVSDPSIPVGTPADLFDTNRYDLGGGTEMEWDFAVTPGSYEVRLYFAETWSGAQQSGVREFDVQIEGVTLLDGYDIFADVGGFAGVTKSFTVTSDSNLDIDFLHQTENPSLQGIEIISAGEVQGLLTTSTNSLDFGNVATGDSAVQVVTLTNSSPSGGDDVTIDPMAASISPAGAAYSFSFVQSTPIVLAPGETTDLTVTFAPLVAGGANATLSMPHSGINSPVDIALAGQGQSSGSGQVVYRVNAGGGGLAGAPIWEADTDTSPSPYLSNSSTNTGVGSTTQTIDLNDPSVPVGTPMGVFQSGRFDLAGSGEMTWDFPVAAGDYEVRLYFSEIWIYAQGVGNRQFDVTIEGVTVLDNYDVFAEVGGYAGVVKSFAVSNTDGNIDIDFLHEVENPAIKGIEIISAPSMVLQPSTTMLDFGSVEVGQTNDLPVVLTNNDSVSVTIDPTDSDIQPAESPFSFAFEQSEEIILAPGEATTVTVTFAPTEEQSDSATLSIPNSGQGSPIDISLSGVGFIAGSVNFSKSVLTTLSPIANPTSLQFGPDGRLYVSEQGGVIHAMTIVRNGATDYEVTDQEVIFDVANILNHDDLGNPEPGQLNRLVTGILVTGTAQNPVLYVSNSDPRIGAGPSGADLNLDTNSGTISRLTWNGTSWDKLDLVRGLPRSEENHGPNGMQLDEVNNILYLAIGGNTNMGATSNNFAFLPEYALSAAILSIDLDAIGETTYDLPTLDDEDHPGADPNDPFGGNDGKNQAILVPGGPVQVYAPGFRNPYDLIITSAGHMFTIDNGPNADWGDIPIGEGPGGMATNDVNEPGVTYGDGLHLITGPGYYGGHPNPTRSNPANTFNPTNPQSPVSVPNAIESDYLIPGVENGALHVYGTSTNGLAEYTASNFGGALQGDLLAASFNNSIRRIELNATGDAVVSTEDLFSNVGVIPLDVTTPVGQFDGSIWVADIGMSVIHVFEPTDGGGGTPDDLDGDGYSNDDEIANGTDPLNAADVPPDNDLDFVSDLLDDDDDNDSILDLTDAFAIDENNGTTTPVGTLYTWENNAPPAGGFFDLGLTGLMTNGVTDYLDQFDDTALTAGGAAGVLTIDSANSGTALGAANSQEQAFQFGVNVGSETLPYAAHTRLVGPFTGQTPTVGQEMGFYVGTGDQDNYVKVVVTGENGGSIIVLKEEGGVVTDNVTTALGVAIPGPSVMDLWLAIDPVTNLLQASYSVDQGARIDVGPSIAVPVSWTASVLAVGLIAVDPSDSGTMPVTWDFLGVEQESVPPSDAEAYVKIDFPSTFGTGSFTITNNSPGSTKIDSYMIDLTTSFMPDVVFDPFGLAGDPIGKDFTPDVGAAAVGLTTHSFLDPHGGGFDKLLINFDDFDPGETFKFSVDVDPTSIQGATPPGPEDSGSISGFELTGTTAEIAFDDGNTFSGETFRQPLADFASEAIIKIDPPTAPSIEVLGLPPSPTVVSDPAQTVRITGAVGDSVRLLVVEGALHLAGVPNGGFDIDPFEINKALSFVEHSATIGAGGTVDVPITLTDTHAEGGFSYIFAATDDASGQTSNLSNIAIVEFDASAGVLDLIPSTTSIDFGSVEIGQSAQQLVTLTHVGAIGSGDITVDTSQAALTPAVGPFSFVFSQTGIVTLAPGETLNVTISFDPTAEQTDVASLDIPHSGDNSPVAIALSGTGLLVRNPIYRVNAGGQVVTGTPDWSIDSSSNPSPFSNVVTASSFVTLNTATIDMSNPALPAGTPVELFASERWDSTSGGEMQWTFPVDAGDYEVRLYFAETFMYAQSVGARMFDVAIEGTTVLDDFDVFAVAGGDAAWVETFTVTSDDMLNIGFSHVVQNPIINAIEILPAPGNLTLMEPPAIKGDFDNNGVVDGFDYLVWLSSGGSPVGDGNSDGKTDQHDVDAWYSEAAALAVPIVPEGEGYWEHPPSGSLVSSGSLSSPPAANIQAVAGSIGGRAVDGSLDVAIPEAALRISPTLMESSEPKTAAAQAPRVTEAFARDRAVEDLFDLFIDDEEEESAETTSESLDTAIAVGW